MHSTSSLKKKISSSHKTGRAPFFVTLAFSALIFTSCGTTSPSESEAVSANAAKFIASANSEDAGEIIFYRQKRIYGSALDMSIHIDNIHVADLNPGEYVKVKAAPGQHKVYSDHEYDELIVNVKPGSQSYFRAIISGSWGGKGKLEAVDSSIGAQEFVTWKVKPTPDIVQPAMVKP